MVNNAATKKRKAEEAAAAAKPPPTKGARRDRSTSIFAVQPTKGMAVVPQGPHVAPMPVLGPHVAHPQMGPGPPGAPIGTPIMAGPTVIGQPIAGGLMMGVPPYPGLVPPPPAPGQPMMVAPAIDDPGGPAVRCAILSF
jgi:hypothetical protein